MDTFVSSFHMAILNGLQYKHVYEGTVSSADKQKRRARNKVAKQSRKRNR